MRKRLCLFEVCLFSMLVPFIVRFFSFDRALKMVEPGHATACVRVQSKDITL